jgi:hypothetical protein
VLLVAILFALNDAALAGQQSQPSIFRAEASAVPFYLSISHGKKPITDLTIAHFTIVLDKQTYMPLNVEQDPEKPGHYVVSFKPPDGVRDGKIHKVEVRVKKRRLNASFKFSIPIQRRPTESRE